MVEMQRDSDEGRKSGLVSLAVHVPLVIARILVWVFLVALQAFMMVLTIVFAPARAALTAFMPTSVKLDLPPGEVEDMRLPDMDPAAADESTQAEFQHELADAPKADALDHLIDVIAWIAHAVTWPVRLLVKPFRKRGE